MNREQRRQASKNEKKIPGEFKYLQTPCTLVEATQIARGVAEDVVSEYQERISHLNLAITVQIELLKSVLIEKGIIDEEQFKERYIDKVKELQEMQKEFLESKEEDENSDVISFSPEAANDVEVRRFE